MAAGQGHSLAVTERGALYWWGYCIDSQLGHGDQEEQLLPKRVEALQERVCSVAAGQHYSLAITQSGALYSWGFGGNGQLGHGDDGHQLLPRQVAGLQGVCYVAAGAAHTVAIAKDGTAHGWGSGACS